MPPSDPSVHARRLALVAAVGGITVAGYQALLGSRTQGNGAFPYRGRVGDPEVALTFDDGPNPPATSALLDLLGDRGVPATFFQVGRNAERYPGLTRRVVAEGHVLGNHSYHHEFRRYVTEPRQQAEVRRGEDALARIAGLRPTLYRPPWLCHPRWVLSSVAAAGLQVVSGTFAYPWEIFQPAPHRIARGAIRAARPGAILIFHDGREARGGRRDNTVAAIAPVIDGLRVAGYRFTTVDRMLGVPAYR